MCRSKSKILQSYLVLLVSKKFKFKVDKKVMEEAKTSFPNEFEDVLNKMSELKLEEKKNLKLKVVYG